MLSSLEVTRSYVFVDSSDKYYFRTLEMFLYTEISNQSITTMLCWHFSYVVRNMGTYIFAMKSFSSSSDMDAGAALVPQQSQYVDFFVSRK